MELQSPWLPLNLVVRQSGEVRQSGRVVILSHLAQNDKSLDGNLLVCFNLTIPRSVGESLSLTVNFGEYLFILGANGTGKSSLMQCLYSPHQANARRILAHRQNWFSSNSISLSPQQKREFESYIRNTDINLESRWKDDYATQRTSIAIYDLIDAENIRARSIAGAVDSDNVELAKTLSKKDAPIKTINELLRLSNIPIEISVRESDQVIASKCGGSPYSIAELSDGERSAWAYPEVGGVLLSGERLI